MKTLIFIPIDNDISGFVEIFKQNGGLKIKYNLKAINVDFNCMYKLYGLSAKKPFNEPLIIDTIEFKNNTAVSEKNFTNTALLEKKYLADDLNTFAIVKKNPITAEIKLIADCFCELVWEIESAFEKKEILPISNPVERGIKTLQSIKKRTETKNPHIKQIWLKRIESEAKKFQVVNTKLSDKYTWYKINDIRPPVDLPSYKHLLFVTDVMELYYENGYYFFGIGKNGHTALAIKTNDTNGINPFVNADDCAEKIDDYFLVGVYLSDDGQYFEKILR